MAVQRERGLMRLLALSAVLIGSVFAQDHPQPKLFTFYDSAATATVNVSPATPINFAASNIQRDVAVLRLKVNAVVKFGEQTIEADEIDYRWDTGKLEARGNVRWIKTIPVSPSR